MGNVIGSPEVPVGAFTDFWLKLAEHQTAGTIIPCCCVSYSLLAGIEESPAEVV
jgi:hypothetical protein